MSERTDNLLTQDYVQLEVLQPTLRPLIPDQTRLKNISKAMLAEEMKTNPSIDLIRKMKAESMDLDWDKIYANDLMRFEVSVEKDFNETLAFRRQQNSFRWVLNHMQKEKYVLDVGCFNGAFTRIMKEEGYYPSGTDVSQHCIDVSKKNNDGLSIPYFKMPNSYQIPVQKELFDYVTCMQVLEHVEDPYLFVEELFRVVKKGGTLFVSTPINENLDDPMHLHHFTLYDIMYLFEKYTDDFKIIYLNKIKKTASANIFMIVARKPLEVYTPTIVVE